MGINDMKFSRRDAIKILGSGAASIYLDGCFTTHGPIPMSSSQGLGFGPISALGPFDRTLGDTAPRRFSGDSPQRAHQVLWDKKNFVDRLGPAFLKPTEKRKLVVVGGGMSGLLSSYMLRHHEPVILEQSDRLGGNSRGESWAGIDYSLATAYFGVPEKNGSIDTLFKEIGVDGRYRVHELDDAIFIGGRRYANYWNEGTIPSSRAQFRRLGKYFTDVRNNANGKKYPQIPITDSEDAYYVRHLDGMTFKAHLEKVAGGALHPHVEEVIEHYFWSAAAASYTEVSAAAGLNFFAGDFDKVAILPGGNGAIAEALLIRLLLEIPKQNIRPLSLVFDVRPSNDAVLVSYLDPEGKAHTIEAQSVVMACPKFVANDLIDEMEPKRREAIQKLRYRSYLVANVLINKPLKDNFYDLFFFRDGQTPMRDVKEAALRQRATDFTYGNFAKPDSERTILTVFRGFPYDGVRKEIYADEFYERSRREFEEQIRSDILPLLNLTPENMVDVRLARWGHPLPVPDAGHIASGRVELLRKPLAERIFFIEQDNWALPAFETAFAEAHHFAPEIDALLQGLQMKMTGARNG